MTSATIEQVEYTSIEKAIPMRRVWAMPNASTFDIPPIRALVKKYLHQSKVSVDPFARNKRWATYTNDLNPETAAESHAEVVRARAWGFRSNLTEDRDPRHDELVALADALEKVELNDE
jgi:hypothetical protein